MHGAPKYPAGFQHFPYVNPAAPKGGRLVLGALGTFDSLNAFIIRGVTPGNLREYVYESLMTRGGDEPFTLYGLIAESVEVPEDRSSVTFHLRRQARFSDGAPITPEDVLFSHAILKEKGWPYHRSHYAKVATRRENRRPQRRFTFAAAGDREIPLILALMPILPRHKIDAETFERTTLEAPIGSGPYTVAKVDAGRSITYRRNPDWWARDLAVARGRFNFDEIRVEYFRDASSLFEAFKAGEIDVRPEDDPARWIEGYGFPAVQDGRVVKREFTTRLPSGMSALVFNTRRPMFEDARVRRAFILLFDAEWINRSLFDGAYKRTQSFFERSELSSHGRPADARERALLAPFAQYVKPEVLDGSFAPPGHGRQRRQPHQLARRKPAAHRGRLPARGRPPRQGRRPPQLRVPGANPPAGAGDAELRPDAGAARHRLAHPPGRYAAILGAPQDLRLRHDPMDLERLPVAGQRADQPLEQQRRRHRGLAQLPRRQEPGRRRHDRGIAAGARGRRTSARRCAPSIAC